MDSEKRLQQNRPDRREQNICRWRRMGVLVTGVCLRRSSGEITVAPHLGILGRGVHQVDGQWGSIVPAFRTPLGAALFVSRQPRDRVGFRSFARQHSRHQLERNVHRIARSVVDWSRFYGAFGAGPAGESGLFGETHRAWPGHGRFRDRFRKPARATLSGSSCFSLQHRFLRSSYTMLAVARLSIRAARCTRMWLAHSLRTTRCLAGT